MKSSSILFGIIGTLAVSLAATNIKGLEKQEIVNDIIEPKTAIKEDSYKNNKNELYGIYTSKNDKKTRLTLNDDGTYFLTINVCDNYLSLTGTYEIGESKLKLVNDNYNYEDLNGNVELTFSIIDNGKIKSDESLICTPQDTLFEK